MITKPSRNQKPQNLIAKVTSRKDLLKHLAQLKNEIGSVSAKMNSLNRLAFEANGEPDRFICDRRKNENEFNEGEIKILEKLKKNAASLAKDYETAKELFDSMTLEINKIEGQVANFKYVAALDEVLSYQKMLAEAEKEVNNFKTLIADQQTIINRATSKVNLAVAPTENLTQKREDLLAEIAQGKASEDNLKTLDNEIAKHGNIQSKISVKTNEIASKAQQTIEGLKRKLVLAENSVDLIKQQKPEVLFQYLMTEAETAGEEYVCLATELTEKFRKLIGLASLVTQYDPNSSKAKILALNWSKLLIPSVNLTACKDLIKPNLPGILFSGNHFDLVQSKKTEELRLRGLGVNLF